MANLFDRLYVESDDYEKISVHYFYAALVDLAAGETTKQQIVAAFNLDAQAEANLDSLITAYQNSTNKNRWLHELHAVMCLSEGGLKYTDGPSFATRMGL